jgi:hypothetical protein
VSSEEFGAYFDSGATVSDQLMDAKQLFGLARIVPDDPEWIWFRDPENYSPVLPKLGLDEGTYLDVWDEVTRVFPLHWARETHAKENQSYGWTGLHPPVLGWLAHHPVASFLATRPYGWATVAPLLRLGLDLIRTRDLPRTQSLRVDLRNLDQYVGRLFELEVLSEFARRGWAPEIVGTPDFRFHINGIEAYAEARHRGAPFGMALSRLVHTPMDADWHRLNITLKRISGVHAEVSAIAGRINKDVETILGTAHDSPISIETDDYAMEHIAEGERRTIRLSYGSHESYASELEHLVLGTLRDKSAQIKAVAAKGHPAILLLDCRSLISPEPRTPDDARVANRAKYMTRILAGGDRFLAENQWVSGIIWWWKKADWPIRLSEMIHEPPLISMLTADGYIESMDTALVAAALRGHD